MVGSKRRQVGGGSQQRALVVGASGHIGNAVVRELLARGCMVTAARRGRSAARNLAGLAVRDVLGDGDCAATIDDWVGGHDVVVDAAAPYPMSRSDDGAIAASARRAEVLVDAIARHRAHLVHVGSFVTREPGGGLGDELHPYFAAKRAGEAVFAAAARGGEQITVVHPTACIGPWDARPNAMSLVPLVLAGQLPVVPAHLVNVIDVRDVARAVVEVGTVGAAGSRGEPVILSGHNVGLPELCALIGELAGRRVTVRSVPPIVTRPGAWAVELGGMGAAPPLLLLIALLTLRQTPLSVGAPQRALGAVPRPLSATLRDAIAWHQGQAIGATEIRADIAGSEQPHERAASNAAARPDGSHGLDVHRGPAQPALEDRGRVRRPVPARTEPMRAMSGMFRTGAALDGRMAGTKGAEFGDRRAAAVSRVSGAAFADRLAGVEGQVSGVASADRLAGVEGRVSGAMSADRLAGAEEDPVRRAVRAGCDVVEQAVRRGAELGRERPAPPWAAWAGGRLVDAWMGANARGGRWPGSDANGGPWTAGRWVDAVTGAFEQWAQQVNAWSTVVRASGTGADPDAGVWASPFRAASPSAPVARASGADADRDAGVWASPFRSAPTTTEDRASGAGSDPEVGAWASPFRSVSPQAEHAGNGNASAVHAERAWSFSASSPQAVAVASKAARALRVELRTARMATVEVELSPDAGAGLEVHGLVAAPALAAPPITDVTIAVIDGGIAIGLGSVEHHPAGTYTGAVIAAGRACGTLTVRLS